MDNPTLITSRRDLSGASTVTIPAGSAASSRNVTLSALCRTYGVQTIKLLRTRQGRELSRARYRRAEEFMMSLTGDAATGDYWPDCLYRAGIVAQLALSSHLLDVGFPDAWLARHIGLRVARSLACANATGFGCDCPETQRLAQVLTPYCRWNRNHQLIDGRHPDDGGFTIEDVRMLLCALLDRVRQVTGHGSRCSARRSTAAQQ